MQRFALWYDVSNRMIDNGMLPSCLDAKFWKFYDDKLIRHQYNYYASRPRWIDNTREDMKKYELTADMTENRVTVLENDGEEWPTNMWRWPLKMEKMIL